jgi:single-strand DNA-binding protein
MQIITVAGRLGKDAELKQSSSGKEYLQFSLACSVRTKDRNGEPLVRTYWYIVTTGITKLHTYLTKGTAVTVVGEYSNGAVAKDGEITIFNRIRMDHLTFQSSSSRVNSDVTEAQVIPESTGHNDDDLPF